MKFYLSFNAIYFRAKNAGMELVCVQLMKSLCLPVLLYAVEVLPLTKSDIDTLNHVLNGAVYRIFGCFSAEVYQNSY